MFFQSLNLYSILFAGLTATIIVFMRQISFYKQQIINKDLKIIPAYLDKIFLYKLLNNNRGSYLALEEIRQYFHLKEIRLLTRVELENDCKLNQLFEDVLNCSNDNSRTTVINRIENNITHKLFVFSEKDKINDQVEQMHIYVKVPYIMSRSDEETLYTFVYLAKMM
ncbi:MAG TPA: hypothetical protein LFW20_05300 [Rickettsia endosymbiont of Omalisus fontisbellaquei]|nr:hypothetical protein [Rickettsia endosymbiont of Omalisus fontisbellaquei]